MEKRKLIFHSNAPWAGTGYGQQTALMAPRIAEQWNVWVSAFYGLQAAPLVWNGIKVLPGLGNTYGLETLPYHVKAFFGEARGGTVLALMDAWVLDADVCGQLDFVCWLPVDHEPAPPAVTSFLRNSGAIPITMTRNGQDMLREFDALYVPHCVDANVYKPVGREFARAQLGLPQDAFIVGQVGANKGNPSRKGFAATLEAFAEFRRRHENSMLYLYTHMTGDFTNGVPLPPLMEQLRIPESAVKFPDPYYTQYHPSSSGDMALLYAAFDVLANPSMGEGFGIPIIEAQACGTPVIVTDFTAMREVGKVGWKVKGSRHWTAQHSWQMIPHVGEILKAFESCRKMSAERKAKMADEARTHALQYDADRVAKEYMLPALEQAQERLQGRRKVVELKRVAA